MSADQSRMDAKGPVRVQLSRRKGWRMPPNTVKVTRPAMFGNPFSHPERRVAVGMFRAWLTGGMRSVPMLDCKVVMPGGLDFRRREIRRDIGWLTGRNLACWCPLDQPCHGDVLLELANTPSAAANGGMGDG